jgi:16S rRNA (cytosine1402-N4)-methyltransferase
MHIPVLLHEIIDGLNLKKGDIVVDATINGGGHSEKIAQIFGDSVHIIGIDLDADALSRSKKKLDELNAKYTLVCDSFKNIENIVKDLNIKKVNAVLFDFGLSSDQFDSSNRGFTFSKDEPLVMTFKRDIDQNDITARNIVNDWAEDSLETIIKGFGEERYAKRIAKAIVDRRDVQPIENTFDLVSIIERAVPIFYRKGRLHPATRTFQALRIAVNGELENISEGLKGARKILDQNGRICAISFHSLEDRIVKRYFRELKEQGDVIINKKPIIPTEEEIKNNPRSRSSKLRILEIKNEL